MALRWVLWVMVGALTALVVVGMASVGILVMPLAVTAFIAARRWAGDQAVVAGVVSGIGLTVVAVGFVNLGYRACPANGVLVLRPGQTSVECGGWNPLPWFAVGAALLATGAVAHLLRRRRRPKA